MRQKVLLSAALLHNPDLLLLDEPFSGLDVGTGLVLRSLIQELAARGKVVLFSSHELETVERVCSHVVILHRGKDRGRRFHRASAHPDGAAHARRHLLATRRRAGHGRHLARDRRPDSGMRPNGQAAIPRPLSRVPLPHGRSRSCSPPHAPGDSNKLLGQFAALLIFVSVLLSIGPAFGFAGGAHARRCRKPRFTPGAASTS